jgi:glyoxalase family protein
MTVTLPGIHHVTAITIDPQSNLDFYTGVMGLRLVKQTVNFDDPGIYHFYYGDESGRPGTVITFFPFTLAGLGRGGSRAVEAVTFAVPAKSLDNWMVRLAGHGVDFDGPAERFGHAVVSFHDPDGLKLEIAGLADEDDRGGDEIRGFDGVTLCVQKPDRTIKLLTDTFGYRQIAEEPGRLRFLAADDGEASLATAIDMIVDPDMPVARQGGGSVHHVAFRARSDEEQEIWRDKIATLGIGVTPVLDRRYFRSIYFREPGGVLFEIATDQPGFAVDEEQLGTALKLPPWLEPERRSIERRLPPVRLPRFSREEFNNTGNAKSIAAAEPRPVPATEPQPLSPAETNGASR